MAKTVREPFRLNPDDRLHSMWVSMGYFPAPVNCRYRTQTPLDDRATSACLPQKFLGRHPKTFLDRHPGMGSIGLLWSCIYYHKMHYTNYLSTIFARPRLCCCCEVCSPAVRVSTPARVFVCSLARVSSSDLRASAPPVNRI